jgi:4-amino-4-deoxy-L-arabinose transferase-like glycosyltransferase
MTASATTASSTSALPHSHSNAIESVRRPLMARILLGDRADAIWARPALWALLVITAVLYLWNLDASGWANSFYAAAVQAGTKSWEAWFFGSLDSSNFITVDKPPASLWIMGLSARLFGFSSWSLLAPQALMGAASVALVFGATRRSLVGFGRRQSAVGGLLAGAILAFTPAAALMFRFDNPDAFLTLLMTAAGYAVIRALPKASWKWLALAGVFLGFAFLTKMLQGLLVLPAFAVAYLLFANTKPVKRLAHLAVAAATLVVGAGWWVIAVALWPASARPYIGGSTNNTVLDLVFGYNGLGRIFGGSGNGGGGGGNSGSSFGGATGLQRLFSSEMGLEISWLLPAALLALVFAAVATRQRSRVDPARAGLFVWGGWLLATAVVFSYMSGTIHPYYTVALAPAIAGLLATATVVLWHGRSRWLGRIGLAVSLLAAGGWGFVLLGENADWLPWLRWLLLAATLLGTLGFVVGSMLSLRRVTAVAVLVGMLGGLGGTVAYSIATASVSHSGSIPSVGSTSSSSGFGGGGNGGGPGGAGFGGTPPASGTRPGGGADAGTGTSTDSSSSTATSSTSLSTLLKASTARWAAAVNGSQSAATLELDNGVAVMAIGGWSSDPTPTLAQFEAWVKAGDIGYYISSGSGGGGGNGSGSAAAIATWVAAHYTATTVGGSTVYDLAAASN